jgi:glycosyltransferase involved in cell wall biosynthesis
LILSDRSIDIVEPTLVSEAGHCGALFQGLHHASPDLRFRLWIDRHAHLPGWGEDAVELHPYFHRRWRKLQAVLLFRRLLRMHRVILVPTASYFDLRALAFGAGGRIPPRRALLYFHKLRIDDRRAQALAAYARRHPNVELFGTSEQIVDRLREAGFANVWHVLPVLSGAATLAPEAAPANAPSPRFRHLLSAGAARADKGFGRIVDLVEILARERSSLPVTVQASGDHYGRYDEQTRADLARLQRANYPFLNLITETLDAQQYSQLFPGAVCLQPYSPDEYGDKMSAITFDALRAGAPVVTTYGTTMARIVDRYGAGIVVQDADPRTLTLAAHEAVRNYDTLHAKALAAGSLHGPQTSWAPMVERLRAATAAGAADR